MENVECIVHTVVFCNEFNFLKVQRHQMDYSTIAIINIFKLGVNSTKLVQIIPACLVLVQLFWFGKRLCAEMVVKVDIQLPKVNQLIFPFHFSPVCVKSRLCWLVGSEMCGRGNGSLGKCPQINHSPPPSNQRQVKHRNIRDFNL